ncbi:MAG: hypothetical protein AAFV53_25200, partial [Myxococcota bacterium]
DGRDKPWHEAFRIGAVQTIIARMKQARHTQLQTLDQPAALVRVQDGLAKRQDQVARYAKKNLNLKAGRNINVDPNAYARGKAAGADFALPDRG